MRDLEELTDEQREIFYAMRRDNLHMSNEALLELMDDVCEDSYDEDGVDYADI